LTGPTLLQHHSSTMERFFKTRGQRFRVVTWGSGDGPALLIHGVHGTADSWDALVQALNGAIPAVAYDQRGHGESSWPEDGYDVRTMADDAAALALELGAPIDVVGHGFGAAVALVMAAHHAHLVRRLVISEPPFEDRGFGPVTRIIMESPEEFGSWEAARAFLAERMVGVAPETVARRTNERLKKDDDGKYRWRGYLPGMRKLLERPMKGLDVWQDAPRILAPTVVVRGTRSVVFPADTFERLARVIPGAEGFQIANVGQALPDERPLALAHLLRGFFSSTD
jgi:pimeloyl-ACP methyl ester carboxylesterase